VYTKPMKTKEPRRSNALRSLKTWLGLTRKRKQLKGLQVPKHEEAE
jgi:hypothetical protein